MVSSPTGSIRPPRKLVRGLCRFCPEIHKKFIDLLKHEQTHFIKVTSPPTDNEGDHEGKLDVSKPGDNEKVPCPPKEDEQSQEINADLNGGSSPRDIEDTEVQAKEDDQPEVTGAQKRLAGQNVQTQGHVTKLIKNRARGGRRRRGRVIIPRDAIRQEDAIDSARVEENSDWKIKFEEMLNSTEESKILKEQKLFEHMKVYPPTGDFQKMPKSFKGNYSQCLTCFKLLRNFSKTNLAIHLAGHKSWGVFQCRFCPSGFSFNSQRNSHEKECSKSSRDTHENDCTPIKRVPEPPKPCQVPLPKPPGRNLRQSILEKRAFNLNNTTKKRIKRRRSRYTSKTYKCSFPSCKSSFTHLINLRTHEESHNSLLNSPPYTQKLDMPEPVQIKRSWDEIPLGDFKIVQFEVRLKRIEEDSSLFETYQKVCARYKEEHSRLKRIKLDFPQDKLPAESPEMEVEPDELNSPPPSPAYIRMESLPSFPVLDKEVVICIPRLKIQKISPEIPELQKIKSEIEDSPEITSSEMDEFQFSMDDLSFIGQAIMA